MALNRLFIANRGEIAVRILRTAKRLGLETVIGVSEADRGSMGAEMADRAVVLGPAPSAKSYLDERLIVHAARMTGCDALHPGYGFLSEKAKLATLCEEEGIVFVGPRPETIDMLGDKLSARTMALQAGVQTVPGTDHVATIADAKHAAEQLGYPVVMKASAGGGGRGMFMARSAEELDISFERASREAENAFGDSRLYMERSALPIRLRRKLHEAAIRITSFAKYRNAGTVEFLYDVDREDFYFIEVNSRIQVEHPVSEEVTGEDLIARQLNVAAGQGIGLSQADVHFRGHAIECRINAEDPFNNFMPAPGRITAWTPPSGEGIRLDTHARTGYLVPPFYDSMIGKLIAKGRDRSEAIERILKAIRDFRLEGPNTTLPLLSFVATHTDFRENRITTRCLEDKGLPDFSRA